MLFFARNAMKITKLNTLSKEGIAFASSKVVICGMHLTSKRVKLKNYERTKRNEMRW
jgi:hypothetical protein